MSNGLVKQFLVARAGNIAVTFAIVAPLLIGMGGAGVDYWSYVNKRQALQEIADSAAIAGARQFALANQNPAIPKRVAEAVAKDGVDRANLTETTQLASVDTNDPSVSVMLTHVYRPTLMVAIYKTPLTIDVAATAVAIGATNVCVIGLDEDSPDTVTIANHANLSASTCAVFSNSTHPEAMTVSNAARMDSAFPCSAGGFVGSSLHYTTMPLSDCPPQRDPLSERIPPSTPSGCDFTNRSLSNFDGAIRPGVYCGGLRISGSSEVRFDPGIYIIKDGRLHIGGSASVTGADVGFYFTGDNADMLFIGAAEIELEAPLSGEMAGILFWQDAEAPGSQTFKIKSPNVHTLVGTIYLPKGEFAGEIAGPGRIADESAYTAIVADKVSIKKKANLVLNTDYSNTLVPVPDGVSGANSVIYLRE